VNGSRITWIVDGQGWGHDSLAEAVAKCLPEYVHTLIARRRKRVTGNRFILELPSLFLERIRMSGADIIVAMHPGGIDESLIGRAVLRLGMKTNGVGFV